MATGHQVVAGAPASAEDAAAGPPVTAEHATRPGAPHGAWPTGGAQAAPTARTPPRLWAGSGGRWLVWVFRVVLWTVLLLIGFRGVAAIVMGYPGPGVTSAAAAAGGGQAGQFPAALAQAYALEFGQVYLSFSPAKATQRARSLAAFLPKGSDPMFGWNGAAARTLQSEQVAGIRVVGSHRAVVTLLAKVNGRLIELGVPIYAKGSGMVVSGFPALLPAPARVSAPREARARPDPVARHSLSLLLPAFFRAYASGDAARLGAFTAGRTPFPGLGGAVRFAGVSRLLIPAAAGTIRHLTVTVVWQIGARRTDLASPAASPAQLSTSYAMTVVRHGASWLVRSITASAIQPWPTP